MVLTSGHLHAGSHEVLRVAGGQGVPLAELLDLVQLRTQRATKTQPFSSGHAMQR